MFNLTAYFPLYQREYALLVFPLLPFLPMLFPLNRYSLLAK